MYNAHVAVFRYGRAHYEEGEYVRRSDAAPGDGLDPVVRIVEDLGTVEVPCGKVDCRANCLEYLVSSARPAAARPAPDGEPEEDREGYPLRECKISPLVNII